MISTNSSSVFPLSDPGLLEVGEGVCASARVDAKSAVTASKERENREANFTIRSLLTSDATLRAAKRLQKNCDNSYLIAWQRQELLILMSAFAQAFLKRASTAAASGFFAAFKVSARP